MSKPIIRHVEGCCRVTLHRTKPMAMHVAIDEEFVATPRIGYDCLMRAIGDALLEAGVNINDRNALASSRR